MEEVFPGIFLIKEKVRFESIKPSENIYILAGNDGLIFDAGYGNKKIIRHLINQIHKIEKLYKDKGKEFKISRILPSHSHPDHISGLKRIRKYLGVKILLIKQTAEIIKNKKNYSQTYDADIEDDYLYINKSFKNKISNRFRRFFSSLIYNQLYKISFIEDPDEIIENNSTIIINGEQWKVFPSPGHSSDHISLYNEEKGILLAGDNILESITTWLGPPDSSLEKYVSSIKRIQQLPNLNIILAAHGRPINAPRGRIQEILEHRAQRSQQVLDIIKQQSETGISLNDLTSKLYPKQGRIIRQMARGWIYLTLKMLKEKGQITDISKNKFTLAEFKIKN